MKEYIKTEWMDHIVERPSTFQLRENDDKTVTLKKVEGEIIQQGTPIAAKYLNNMENGIYQLYLNFEDLLSKFTAISVEVAILKNASLNNLSNNVFFENFDNLNSINLINGTYDLVNKRLVI